MTMKKVMFVSLAMILFCTSRIVPWGLDLVVTSWVSRNRQEMGLRPVYHSEALALSAIHYAEIMRDKQEQHHGLLPSPLKISVITANMEITGEQSRLASLYIYENLVSLKKDDFKTGLDPKWLARVYDISPPHAAIMYHEKAVYMGWGIVEDDKMYWIATYIALEYK